MLVFLQEFSHNSNVETQIIDLLAIFGLSGAVVRRNGHSLIKQAARPQGLLFGSRHLRGVLFAYMRMPVSYGEDGQKKISTRDR